MPTFAGSPCRDLNSFTENKVRLLRGKFALPPGAELDRVFAALVGPSFVGKTQSAFCISSKPVLYFPVNPSKGARHNQQAIYRNYYNHGRYFNVAAGTDYNSMKFRRDFQGIQAKDLELIKDMDLHTLGF